MTTAPEKDGAKSVTKAQQAFWFGAIVGAFVVWGCVILAVAFTPAKRPLTAWGAQIADCEQRWEGQCLWLKSRGDKQ